VTLTVTPAPPIAVFSKTQSFTYDAEPDEWYALTFWGPDHVPAWGWILPNGTIRPDAGSEAWYQGPTTVTFPLDYDASGGVYVYSYDTGLGAYRWTEFVWLSHNDPSLPAANVLGSFSGKKGSGEIAELNASHATTQTFSFLGRTDWYYAVYWCPGMGEWKFIYPGAPFGDHWRYGDTLADYPLHHSEAAGVWLYSNHLSSWGQHVWFAHDVLP
jgi:hypothetical protein